MRRVLRKYYHLSHEHLLMTCECCPGTLINNWGGEGVSKIRETVTEQPTMAEVQTWVPLCSSRTANTTQSHTSHAISELKATIVYTAVES